MGRAEHHLLDAADAIVADAELIRKQVTGGSPWSVLGQSYGGFCTVSYLSMAPDGIRPCSASHFSTRITRRR